jgi:hypothetical protein
MTLILLYPALAPFLKTVPNHLEGKVRVYDAWVALDVINRLQRMPINQTEETDKEPVC